MYIVYISIDTLLLECRVLSGLGLELNCLKICVLLQIVQILRGYPERAFVEFAGVHNKSENQLLQKVNILLLCYCLRYGC